MATFSELGVGVERSFQTSSTSIGAGSVDMQLSSKETTKLVLTLPKDAGVRASFRRESWGDSLVKIFKKEIQTGDSEFDKLVHITTDTPEATTELLASAEVRGAIGLTIETGGPVEIDGAKVVATVVGRDAGDDASVVTLVQALLAR